jgi:REP element-mobilizing transposase RayT
VPRPLRAFFDGVFHLAVHASDTRHLFITDEDRAGFLKLLSSAFARYELTPVSYTLMGNHYHLIVRTPDPRLSRAMQDLHTAYSRLHNRVHERSAHLFRAHFASREITSDEQLITTCRYVAQKPVKARLSGHALSWRWGSSRAHAGIEPPAIPLDETPLRGAFDDRPDWRESYRRIMDVEAP